MIGATLEKESNIKKHKPLAGIAERAAKWDSKMK